MIQRWVWYSNTYIPALSALVAEWKGHWDMKLSMPFIYFVKWCCGHKGYSAPEKNPPFGCRNGWGFEKFNSENFPVTGCMITYKGNLGGESLRRLKFFEVAQGQFCWRKISEKIIFYLNIFHQNDCNLPTTDQVNMGIVFFESLTIFTSIKGYGFFFWCRVPLVWTPFCCPVTILSLMSPLSHTLTCWYKHITFWPPLLNNGSANLLALLHGYYIML
jgi:hypothetical protein